VVSVSDPQDRKLLKVWRELLVERDGDRCQKCGKQGVVHAHHYYGRRQRPGRWLPINGIMLCSGCHKLNSSFSAHETPQLFTDWFREMYPERDDKMRIIHQKPFKGTYEDVVEMQKDLG
jgi:ribosomal protein S27AE